MFLTPALIPCASPPSRKMYPPNHSHYSNLCHNRVEFHINAIIPLCPVSFA